MDHIYRLLESIGYVHPLHPTMTHFPIGLVAGAFVLGLLSLLFRREDMARAARFCIVIALISVFPTVFFGFMDWQHYYAGGWLSAITVKIALAIVLFILLGIALIFFRDKPRSVKAVITCGFSFLITIGLGYFGGQLVYTGRVPPASPEFQKGAYVFRANCSGCHPYGGNIADPSAMVRGSPELTDLKRFIRWIRDPRLDNGKRGLMPVFTSSRIPDAKASELWAYLSDVMGTEKKPEDHAELQGAEITVRTDPKSIRQGEKLFGSYCSGCHAADSTATVIGPGLKDVLKRKALPVSGRTATAANIYQQLKAPYRKMPSFAQKLNDDQMLDIIAYLNTR